jgi:hypothetical protein
MFNSTFNGLVDEKPFLYHPITVKVGYDNYGNIENKTLNVIM